MIVMKQDVYAFAHQLNVSCKFERKQVISNNSVIPITFGNKKLHVSSNIQRNSVSKKNSEIGKFINIFTFNSARCMRGCPFHSAWISYHMPNKV